MSPFQGSAKLTNLPRHHEVYSVLVENIIPQEQRYTSENTNMFPKQGPFLGKAFFQPSFLRDIFVFRGVPGWRFVATHLGYTLLFKLDHISMT